MGNKKNKNADAKAEKPTEEILEEELEKAAEECEELSEEIKEEAVGKTDESEARIKELEKAVQDEKDKYMRLFAEFDNFRKRTTKEKTESYGDATAKTLSEIIPVIDNFDRALDVECSDESFKKGVEMIFTSFMDVLKKLGVEEIEALNQPFDPNIHNAIKQIESEDYDEATVCERRKDTHTFCS